MKKSTKQAVVFTGDVVSSSVLTSLQRKKLNTCLTNFIANTTSLFPDFRAELFRGDSIQGILTKQRVMALRTALLLQSSLLSKQFKLRVAIGAGEINFSSSNVITSDGSAFQLSGPLLDELKKKNEYIGITGPAGSFEDEWRVHSTSLNYLLDRWTPLQAAAIFFSLQNLKQEETAVKLKISQPSVHQRLQAAGWPVINSILQRFETVIPSL